MLNVTAIIKLMKKDCLVEVPRSCQCMLMSATTNESMEELQKLVLHNPITLDLLQSGEVEDGGENAAATSLGSAAEIQHFSIQCPRWAGRTGCNILANAVRDAFLFTPFSLAVPK